VEGHEDRHDFESDLLPRVRAGDADAFGVLVEQDQRKVFAVVGRHVPPNAVADVAQETFVSAWRSVSSFRGDCTFATWLCRLAIRRCHDYWRKSSRRSEPVAIEALTDEQAGWLNEALRAADEEARNRLASRADAADVLDRVLGRLAPDDRMIVTLLHLEGRPVKEVADDLGWSPVRVKVRALRARRKLREAVEALRKEAG
jgi:RNA polymerase sigma-70 factor, ECF subfamily